MNKVEIDLNAITANLRYFRSICDSETKIIGVVKSEAYGHGLLDVARVVWTAGADILAVVNIEEAVALRVAKIKAPIIILSYVDAADYRKVIDFDLTVTAYDFESIFELDREAKAQNKWAKVDIKIDTGMNRYGFRPHEVLHFYKRILNLEHIKIEGIHSHFSDPSDTEFSKEQIRLMQNALFSFQQNGITIPMVHMAATDAAIGYPEAHFDAIRIGIGLYGYCRDEEEQKNLQPVMELKSIVSDVRFVSPNETIGYGRTFKTTNPTKIAVVPIGYYDGYSRSLSNKAEVAIAGKRAKVVGQVCMNILMVDVTGIKCARGDEVVLIGRQGSASIFADELARISGTVTHEILSRIPAHIVRAYHFK
jgi:alanine racemase